MSGDNAYKSVQDFLRNMDSGRPTWNLREETKKLTPDQIEEITQILLQRSSRPPELK